MKTYQFCRRQLALGLGFLFMALLLSMNQVQQQREALAQRIAPALLRFHILANSDSSADQQVKLEVRSLILDYIQELLPPEQGKKETIRCLREQKAAKSPHILLHIPSSKPTFSSHSPTSSQNPPSTPTHIINPYYLTSILPQPISHFPYQPLLLIHPLNQIFILPHPFPPPFPPPPSTLPPPTHLPPTLHSPPLPSKSNLKLNKPYQKKPHPFTSTNHHPT